jgi:hypothetical protein
VWNRRVRRVHLAREDVYPFQIALVADAHVVDPLRVLGVGQECARAELRRPLEGDAVLAFGRPLTLQVRIAPRRPLAPDGFTPGLRARRGRSVVRPHTEHQQACRDRQRTSTRHVVLLAAILGPGTTIRAHAGPF